jgi:hypothetical protein
MSSNGGGQFMKGKFVGFAVLAAALSAGLAPAAALAQDRASKVEFIDIRWDGVDKMCVIYPDGRVDFFYPELKSIPRPDDANKRAFYLTIQMNRMAAQGYEFVSMISDEIIMKRTVAR